MSLAVMRQAVGAVERGARGVVVTVLSHRGSSPGKMGQKFLLLADGTVVGTVGGGKLEALALGFAREALATGVGRAASLLIAEEGEGATGQTCGGRVEMAVEVLPVLPRVLLCGAGHVSAEVARLLAQLGYPHVVHDDRRALASSERFPSARCIHGDPASLAEHAGELSQITHALLLSRGHATDRAYGVALSRAQYAGWLGMMASRRKARLVREAWVAEDGLDARFVARVESPVGIPIGARNPPEIAVSIVARLVQLATSPEGERTG